MGLFFKSQTDNIKEQIQRHAAKINEQLRLLAQEVDNNGITISNMELLAQIMNNINIPHAAINSLLQQLDASQQSSLMLPWMDGRYLPIFVWDGSFRMIMAKFIEDIEQAERHYGRNI